MITPPATPNSVIIICTAPCFSDKRLAHVSGGVNVRLWAVDNRRLVRITWERNDALELDSRPSSRQHGGMTDQIARILITLYDIEPAIWRRIEMPLTNSIKTLHLAIQAAMLFENYHLFRFDVGEAIYGIRFDDDYMDPPTRDAGNMRLAKLVERGTTGFIYTYDFGDDWRHSIVIEAVLAADPTAEYPRFVDGERGAPPEDVGGPPGFEQFLDAMAKPHHPEHKSVLQWYGRHFHPNDISPTEIDARMATLAKRRASGKPPTPTKRLVNPRWPSGQAYCSPDVPQDITTLEKLLNPALSRC